MAQQDLTDEFWRNVFILCILGGDEVPATPDAWALEVTARRLRATAQMRDIASRMPPPSPETLERSIADGRFGDAFATLVYAARDSDAPSEFWSELAGVSATLRLNELVGDEEPGSHEPGYVSAAWLVSRRT